MVRFDEDDHQFFSKAIDQLTQLVGLDGDKITPYEAAQSHSLGAENIMGFGYGVKLVNGVIVDRPAICGYVVRKAREDEVAPDFKVNRLVQQVTGFSYLSDVLEVGRPQAFADKFTRRIPGGASIDEKALQEEGTLGGWIRNDNDELYVLGCWHVLDGQTHLSPTQSIRHDKKVIGKPVVSVHPKNDYRSGHATVDASIAEVFDSLGMGDFILSLGEIRGPQKVQVRNLPLRLRKYGAATGLTTGSLVHMGASILLDMSIKVMPFQPTLTYHQQMLIYPGMGIAHFSRPGDSGALVVTDENYVVGMLVGGGGVPVPGLSGVGPPLSVATPIEDVLAALKRKTGRGFRLVTYP